MTDDPKPVPTMPGSIEELGPDELSGMVAKRDTGHAGIAIFCGPAIVEKIESLAGMYLESPDDTVCRIFGTGLELVEAAATEAHRPEGSPMN